MAIMIKNGTTTAIQMVTRRAVCESCQGNPELDSGAASLTSFSGHDGLQLGSGHTSRYRMGAPPCSNQSINQSINQQSINQSYHQQMKSIRQSNIPMNPVNLHQSTSTNKTGSRTRTQMKTQAAWPALG